MEALIIVVGLLALGFWHADRKKASEAAQSSRISQEVEYEMAAEQQAYEEARDVLLSHASSHLGTLASKRRQLLYKDDYGNEERKPWRDEVGYFVDRVCPPVVREAYSVKFGIAADNTAAVDIEEWLDRLPHQLSPSYEPTMSGVEFERLVAERLVSVGAAVRSTPVTGDQGADLVVQHNGQTIVIQCKRSGSTVGNKAVQEAYAGRKFHGAEQAWVVSDAPFSRSARQLASSLSVRLVDFDQVEAAL